LVTYLGEFPQGVLAGADQHLPPAVAARQHAVGQRRQEAGSDHRGLAAPRGADHTDQARPNQVGDQFGDQPLPPEEEPGIITFIAAQALIGADHLGQRVASIPRTRLLLARAQFLQVDQVSGQLGLDQAQVAAAGGGLPGGLLHLAFSRRVRPVSRCLVHQQRHAAGTLQDRGGGILCCRRALVQAENLGDLLPAERAQPLLRRAAGVQLFDQAGKLRRGCYFPVGAQHQEPPGAGRGRKTRHSLQRCCLGQVEVI
jgi:hypothetical protein